MDTCDDIRAQLRGDHEATLAELDALRDETDDGRCGFRLKKLRRAWVTHALAEEMVVYRALEGVEAASSSVRADERFAEHDLVDGLFDKLVRGRRSTSHWKTRLGLLRDLIAGHAASEQEETFARLSQRLDPEGMCELGRQFQLARRKLRMLEDAKAA